MAVWIPVTVVPTSWATVAIDTFITELSSVMRNCAAASVSKTLPAPFAAVVVAPTCSIRRMLPASAWRRVHQLGGHDQALARGVPGIAGRQHERGIRGLRQHLARRRRGQHEVLRYLRVVAAVPRAHSDHVARLDLI